MLNNEDFIDEKKLFEVIGKNIRFYRRLYSLTNNEMTQEKLAEAIEVSTSLIGNLESKKTSQGISLYNLYKISIILNVPLDKFFTENQSI